MLHAPSPYIIINAFYHGLAITVVLVYSRNKSISSQCYCFTLKISPSKESERKTLHLSMLAPSIKKTTLWLIKALATMLVEPFLSNVDHPNLYRSINVKL